MRCICCKRKCHRAVLLDSSSFNFSFVCQTRETSLTMVPILKCPNPSFNLYLFICVMIINVKWVIKSLTLECCNRKRLVVGNSIKGRNMNVSFFVGFQARKKSAFFWKPSTNFNFFGG